MDENYSAFAYLVSSVCFIMALRGLSSPVTARIGNIYGIVGMVVAIATTLAAPQVMSFTTIVVGVLIGGSIGTVIALRIQMTALPQLVAVFHSLVGLAAVFVAAAAFYQPEAYNIGTFGEIAVASLVEMSLGAAIGAMTFTGSIIAFAKLQGIMSGAPVTFTGQHAVNGFLGLVIIGLIGLLCASQAPMAFWMIIVISKLNSYSGWAACGIGFTLANPALIVTGALVGSSGAILSYVMCKGMNRSFISVILGGFGGESGAPANVGEGDKTVRPGSAEDAAFIMKNADSVIIVPGYGMAVAQAQHVLREMADMLKAEGIKVSYAIHPVAGRMPGHMNVLLAEANVPYDEVFELDQINRDFASTSVAFVIGANDVTNPAAKTDPSSAIYGMPILDVEESGTVLFIKRSLSSGYAGVDNELFYRDNTMMLFGDAKAMCEGIVKAFDDV